MKKRIHIPVNRSDDAPAAIEPEQRESEPSPQSRGVTQAKSRSGPVVGLAIALLVIAGLAATAYYLITQDIQLSVDQGISEAELSRQLDTIVSSARLLELSQRKARQDQLALKAAEERSDQVLLDTFRLSLEKSSQDQREYQAVWADALSTLHAQWVLRGQRIESAFVTRIETLDKAQIGAREALEKSLTWIRSVPENTPPGDYFAQQLAGG